MPRRLSEQEQLMLAAAGGVSGRSAETAAVYDFETCEKTENEWINRIDRIKKFMVENGAVASIADARISEHLSYDMFEHFLSTNVAEVRSIG